MRNKWKMRIQNSKRTDQPFEKFISEGQKIKRTQQFHSWIGNRKECLCAFKNIEMFIVVLLIIARNQKMPKCPKILEQITYDMFTQWNITQQ